MREPNTAALDAKTSDSTAFSRQLRLLKRHDFDRVFAAPLKSSDRYLTVLARPNDLKHPRLGLMVAKKRLRLAVQRNRIKRLARESFRCYQHNLDSLDYVVLVRSHIAEASNQAVSASLARHWQCLLAQCSACS